MNTGHNPMLPLSDFTVTFVDHNPKKIKMEWHQWWAKAGYPGYSMKDYHKVIFDTMKEPKDVEIIMPPNNPPYELVWAT
jgi:hypothetical protein